MEMKLSDMPSEEMGLLPLSDKAALETGLLTDGQVAKRRQVRLRVGMG